MNNDFFDKMNNNEKTNNQNMEIYSNKNKIANILKVIGWITIVLGFIGGFIIGSEEFSIAFIVWLVGGLSALFVFALAEIIQILHDIRTKIKK